MQADIRCVVDCANVLGEVPLWDVAEQALYWVDIEGKRLHRLTPTTGMVDIWDMPERIASFALREKGGLVVAFASGLAFLDLDTMKIDWIARPEAHLPGNRFNEGKVDRNGRFWAGTMDDSLAGHTAALYRLDPDLTLTKVLGDIGISNCFVWSRTDDHFWFADTLDKQVFTFDYDSTAGALSNRQIFVDMTGLGYGPDGGTIDEEGCIWIAMWDGWKVSRFTPDGQLDREVHLPVARPSSCMFGGPDLSTLYVTTAIWDATADDLKGQPQAGGLFAIDAGVRGLPETRFAG
ncbi:SMP-30/gluconolactonase/LRE family protein [Rhizobium sp. TH2]|uniref:SMP-30/gluconolactonase/LRE family protein n=1 Tax=Rhizobium sp. TH2 TaxID=2775403 RepID=UPI002157798B|nr:SMP-30/gluconolactonase/LRE family protein [Rhizobium sp. TH2]UVC09468.1 SMP-30/gluconolactonase/LRE family protein [Rhizobium sp. TH2]